MVSLTSPNLYNLILNHDPGYNAFIPHFTVSTFMTSYIGVAIYLVNILSYKVYAKTKKVELTTMDLVTNRLEDDGSKYPSTLEKAVSWVMGRCKY